MALAFRSLSSAAIMAALCLCLTGWADTLDGVKRDLADIKSLSCDFRQKKTTPLLAKPLVSEGRMYFQAPSSIKWEYTKPFRDVLVLDKGKSLHYSIDEGGTKKVIEDNSPARTVIFEEIAGWLQGNFESRNFKAVLKQGKPRLIVLTPKAKGVSSFVTKIDLALSDRPGIIDYIKIHEKENASTVLEFRNIELNGKIDAAIFRIEE